MAEIIGLNLWLPQPVIPHSNDELLAFMALYPDHRMRAPAKRRWQILYQTAVWAIWKAYLSHSFAEPHDFWHPDAALEYHKELIRTRIFTDRAVCIKEVTRSDHYDPVRFQAIWWQYLKHIRVRKGPLRLARPAQLPSGAGSTECDGDGSSESGQSTIYEE